MSPKNKVYVGKKIGPPKKGYFGKRITAMNKKLLKPYGLKVPK